MLEIRIDSLLHAIAPLFFIPLLSGCAPDYTITPEPVDVDPGDITECDFTRVAGTAFWAYDCNPVFTTSGEKWAANIDSTAYHVTEVLGHPFYQLWYAGVPGKDTLGDYGLGYAVSAEGTEWIPNTANPLLAEPQERQAWDRSARDQIQVLWDPYASQYMMLFQGYNLESTPSQWGMGLATSPDGLSWSLAPNNPIADFTSTLGENLFGCWPLSLGLGEVGGYTGYFGGYKGRTNNSVCEIYAMHSADTLTWTPDPEPFLAAGARGDWDDSGYGSMSISKLGELYYLFYVGFGDWEIHDGYQSTLNLFLGMATSPDGKSWVKVPGPLPISNTEEGLISAVASQTVGSRIHLWVTDQWGDSNGVGYFLYDPERAAREDGAGR